MSGVLARVAATFLEPVDEAAPRRHEAERALPDLPCAGVVGRGRPAEAVAVALALHLGHEHRSASVLLAAAGAPAGLRAPAGRAAARAVTALGERDLEAVAAGRLVRVRLRSDRARVDFHRAAAAAPGPAVVLVAEARTPEWDALLAEQDLVVLAADLSLHPAVRALAEESLAALGPPVVRCDPPSNPAAVALARTGAPLPSGMASALRPALERLS